MCGMWRNIARWILAQCVQEEWAERGQAIMGNRAVLAFGNPENPQTIGIYLHWNGGRESVEGFLDAAHELRLSNGPDYILARFTQMIANFFGGTNSIGIGPLDSLDCDNGDNGLFQIDPEALTIIGRRFHEEDAVGVDEKYRANVKEETLRINGPIFQRQ